MEHTHNPECAACNEGVVELDPVAEANLQAACDAMNDIRMAFREGKVDTDTYLAARTFYDAILAEVA